MAQWIVIRFCYRMPHGGSIDVNGHDRLRWGLVPLFFVAAGQPGKMKEFNRAHGMAALTCHVPKDNLLDKSALIGPSVRQELLTIPAQMLSKFIP